VSRVERDGDSCRADVYARTTLVDWNDVDLDAPSPLGGIRTEWTAVEGRFTKLAVSTVSGAEPPGETAVAVAQLVSGDSGRQAEFDEDPLGLTDALSEIGEFPELLLAFDRVLEGGESDLLPLVEVQSANPAGVVNDSYFSDDAGMYLVTVASVSVPLEVLDALGPTELSITVEEEVTFTADINYKLFGKDLE
jgi:hypothetical protein